MANDKNIKIGFQTTADTSGADRAAQSINRVVGVEERRNAISAQFLTAAEAEVEEVNRLVRASNALTAAKEEEERATQSATQAMWKQQAQLDVAEAKIRQASRATTAQTGQVKNLGMVATQVGFQVTDFATQVNMGTSAITAFSQQAPQAIGALTQFGGVTGNLSSIMGSAVSTGTALSMIVTALAIGGSMAATEYGAMTAALKELEDAQKRYTAQLEYTKLMIKEIYKDRLIAANADFGKKEAENAERELEALERIHKLQAAQGGTAAAQAQLAITQAKNSGGDVVGAQANAIEGSAQTQLSALDAKLAEAEKKVEAILQNTEELNFQRLQTGQIKGPNSEEAKTADAAYEKAVAAADKAKLDLENQRAIIEQEKEALMATIQSSVSDLGAGVQADLLSSLTAARDEIAKAAQAQGGELSASAKAAFQKLNETLKDGMVSDVEVQQLGGTMQLLKNSNEQIFGKVFTGVEKLVQVATAAKARADLLEKRISDLEAVQ